MHSDVEATSFCALCGMPLEKGSTRIWRYGEEHYTLCSQYCLHTFKKREGRA